MFHNLFEAKLILLMYYIKCSFSIVVIVIITNTLNRLIIRYQLFLVLQ